MTYHQLAAVTWTWTMTIVSKAKHQRAPAAVPADFRTILVDLTELADQTRLLLVNDGDLILASCRWITRRAINSVFCSVEGENKNICARNLKKKKNKRRAMYIARRSALFGTSNTSAATSCRSFYIWGRKRRAHVLHTTLCVKPRL
jgi:hypothetical protein